MATRKTASKKRTLKPKVQKVEIWSCKDLKALIKEEIKAHVKDAKEAKALEAALADIVAYAPASQISITKEKNKVSRRKQTEC